MNEKSRFPGELLDAFKSEGDMVDVLAGRSTKPKTEPLCSCGRERGRFVEFDPSLGVGGKRCGLCKRPIRVLRSVLEGEAWTEDRLRKFEEA